MILDFSTPGECHVMQPDHIKEIINEWPNFDKSKTVLTPASKNLFERGEGGLLNNDDRELMHRVVAKALFVSCRSRPDITPTVSVLTGRVREPIKADWLKTERLVRYLHSTQDLHLVLRYNGLSITKWHVDAAFAVHPDYRSHSGGTCFIHPEGGGIASGSLKQKINTRSSTTAELVAVDDFLSKIIWLKNFMESQAIPIRDNILLQDNKSSILMAEKGRTSLGKRTRAMNVRYFAITDHVGRGEIKIHHCPTDDMVGDFFSKPLQGSKFLKFRALLLGLKNPTTGGGSNSVVEGEARELREISSNMTKTDVPRRNSARKAPLRVSSKR